MPSPLRGTTPRSLILDLLSSFRGTSVPVGALVAAGALFEHSDNGMRVALARLRAARVVERDERGRYRLAASAQALNRRVISWRRVEERMVAWSGAWVAALGPGDTTVTRPVRRRGARALEYLGFRALRPGLEVRPDNLAGGVDAVRRELQGLGLDPSVLVVRMDALPGDAGAKAATLWNGAEIRAQHRESLAELAASGRRLAGLPRKSAMVESFEIGGRAIRRLVLDPLLPDALVASDERQALIAALHVYDARGRQAWSAFMERFGIARNEAPADLRLETSSGRRAAAGGMR